MTILSLLPEEICSRVLSEWFEQIDLRILDATFTLSNSHPETLDLFNSPNFFVKSDNYPTGNSKQEEENLKWVCMRGVQLKCLKVKSHFLDQNKHLMVFLNSTRLEHITIYSGNASTCRFDWDFEAVLVKAFNLMKKLKGITIYDYDIAWDSVLSLISPDCWKQFTTIEFKGIQTVFHMKSLALIAKYCTHLTHVDIQVKNKDCAHNIHELDLVFIFQHNKLIENIRLSNCPVTAHTLFSICKNLKHLKDLLVYGSTITLNHVSLFLQRCTELNTLTANTPEYIRYHRTSNDEKWISIAAEGGDDPVFTNAELIDFFTKNKNFHSIDIDILSMSGEAVALIAQNNPNLRGLVCNGESTDECTSQEPIQHILEKDKTLSALELKNCSAVKHSDLLTMFKTPNVLTTLEISNHRSVSVDTILDILHNCKHINSLTCFENPCIVSRDLRDAVEQFCHGNQRKIKLTTQDKDADSYDSKCCNI